MTIFNFKNIIKSIKNYFTTIQFKNFNINLFMLLSFIRCWLSISFFFNKWNLLKNSNKLCYKLFMTSFIQLIMFYLVMINLKYFMLDLIYYMVQLKVLEMLYVMLIIVLISAYMSLLESQVVGILQQRFGPSLTGGFWSLMQPIADGFKLLTKEMMIPSKAKIYLFLLAPIYTFVVTLTMWTLMPFSSNNKLTIINKEYTLLMILVLLILAAYGPMMGGWASNNKYALLGAYSSIALSGSYGITMGLLLIFPILYAQTFNMFVMVYEQLSCWYIFPLFEASIFFWIMMLTEIKKVPFDVSESEAELSSGYLMEYSGFNFALFIISEYASMLLLVMLYIMLFLGGWNSFNQSFFMLNTYFNSISFLQPWLMLFTLSVDYWIISFKMCLILIFYLTMSTVLPNYSFDYIMTLHWKYLFPLLLNLLFFNILLL